MAEAADRVKRASALIAEAITELASLGPEAPISVRECMTGLASAYIHLGYADPGTDYSIPREDDFR